MCLLEKTISKGREIDPIFIEKEVLHRTECRTCRGLATLADHNSVAKGLIRCLVQACGTLAAAGWQ